VFLPKDFTGLSQDSLVLVHQIRTISKNRLENVGGDIKEMELVETINNALRIHLNV
jgi:mRNA interferase MazF